MSWECYFFYLACGASKMIAWWATQCCPDGHATHSLAIAACPEQSVLVFFLFRSFRGAATFRRVMMAMVAMAAAVRCSWHCYCCVCCEWGSWGRSLLLFSKLGGRPRWNGWFKKGSLTVIRWKYSNGGKEGKGEHIYLLTHGHWVLR